MTWGRQVLHVIAKDVRQWKVIYAMYAAIVLVATIHSIAPYVGGDIFEVSTAFVIVAGMVLAGLVVQGDSPTRADAFWASRPLQSSAVATAKFAQALLLIAIPLAGQVIALLARGIAVGSLPHYLPESIGIFGLWIAAALVSAALTKDVSAAAIAFICVSILFGLTLIATDRAPQWPLLAHIAIGTAQVVVGLGILFFMYARRVRSKPVAVAGALVMIAPLIGYLPYKTPTNDAIGESRVLHVELAEPVSGETSDIKLRLWVNGLNASQRAVIHDATVTITLKSGKMIYINRYDIPLSEGDSVPMKALVKWLGTRAVSPFALVPVHLRPDEQALVTGGIRKINVAGLMTVMQPRVLDTLALRRGAQRREHDQHVLLDQVSMENNDLRLVIHVSGPTPTDNTSAPFDPYMANAPHFALINDRRGEATPINGISAMTRNAWLVMPGVYVSDRDFTLSLRNPPVVATMMASTNGQAQAAIQPPTPLPVPLSVDSAWLSDAKLLMLEWKMMARYPVTGTTELQ
jgi:hypothetical protein